MMSTAEAMRERAMAAKIERVKEDLKPIFKAIESAAKGGAFYTEYIFTSDVDEYTLKDIARDMTYILKDHGFKVVIIECDDPNRIHFKISWELSVG